MVVRGHIHNGVVVLDEPVALPEGCLVRVEVVGSPESAPPAAGPPRLGGQWKGQVVIGADFDELPADLADALGMSPS